MREEFIDPLATRPVDPRPIDDAQRPTPTEPSVEIGTRDDVYHHAAHPYTKALMSSVKSHWRVTKWPTRLSAVRLAMGAKAAPDSLFQQVQIGNAP